MKSSRFPLPTPNILREVGFPPPNPKALRAFWALAISATLTRSCGSPAGGHTGESWESRHPDDRGLFSLGRQGRKVLSTLWSDSHGGGATCTCPGLQSQVPVADVKSCSVMNCFLSLLCDTLSAIPLPQSPTPHSVEGLPPPWDGRPPPWDGQDGPEPGRLGLEPLRSATYGSVTRRQSLLSL